MLLRHLTFRVRKSVLALLPLGQIRGLQTLRQSKPALTHKRTHDTEKAMLSSVPDESETSSHEDVPVSPRVMKILELSARHSEPVEFKPARSQVPEDDVFFWQCTSCTKFNQIAGNDMNHLLEPNTRSRIQRVDSASSIGGTRLPQVFVLCLFVELPQKRSLKDLTLNSCMHTFEVCLVFAYFGLNPVHVRPYTHIFLNSHVYLPRACFLAGFPERAA